MREHTVNGGAAGTVFTQQGSGTEHHRLAAAALSRTYVPPYVRGTAPRECADTPYITSE
ncbi:hypothetical protein GCM10028793_64640 [Nocardiopsis oceani]